MAVAPRRLMERIADASVLLPAALGVLALVLDFAEYGREAGGGSVCVALCAISGVLHLWFRAEDRWRRRRLLSEARRGRRRAPHAA